MTVATPTTLQESFNIESGDNFSLWRDVEPFPVVLHRMLGEMENEGSEHIISWNDDGLSFAIHKPKEFADTILTRYFRNQTRYKSFQRQLNLYRFRRVSTAKERAAYAHKSFVRDSPHLCQFVRRTRKRPSVPEVLKDSQNLPIESITFIPTMLPFESSLTHSATLDVKNNHIHGNQHAKTPHPIAGVNSRPDLEFSSPTWLGPIRTLPCPSPKWASEFSPAKWERSESHLSLREWLATLRPAYASASMDHAWDDLSIGSIDFDNLATPSSIIVSNHNDSQSWDCCSVDDEIFP